MGALTKPSVVGYCEHPQKVEGYVLPNDESCRVVGVWILRALRLLYRQPRSPYPCSHLGIFLLITSEYFQPADGVIGPSLKFQCHPQIYCIQTLGTLGIGMATLRHPSRSLCENGSIKISMIERDPVLYCPSLQTKGDLAEIQFSGRGIGSPSLPSQPTRPLGVRNPAQKNQWRRRPRRCSSLSF